ncbi:MAG: PmoA family protein [Candidatus Latescibacteria bacterium]|jgi:hypothetical protein|nr:hypothetical protein [Gemmatimonadaceae bacterium]MDP6016193.1 PmoA family protein [Candidatus Latescibacterota bacterium]MDP7447870.1 PmoA family protein [Candidatus Latescibacterota bacterium]HJP29878.1 DUF6807 family protein [Candidatus Latescibacterota bacterium]
MKLSVRETILGFDLFDGETPLAVYRACEHLPRADSPKPCFAPIYTASGRLVTEYRPADHTWHTGLYYGWVHANEANLWGGPWYLPEKDKYEHVEGTHGVQRHDGFDDMGTTDAGVRVREGLTWLDAADEPMATERRAWDFEPCVGGYRWRIETAIQPVGGPLTLGASRKSHYSGLELRLGPPFASNEAAAGHCCSEGRQGHEQIMHQPARWVSAAGAQGGIVALFDHPTNPRHPVPWFTRANLLGAGLLINDDLTIGADDTLRLRYRLLVLDDPAGADRLQDEFADFAGDDRTEA